MRAMTAILDLMKLYKINIDLKAKKFRVQQVKKKYFNFLICNKKIMDARNRFLILLPLLSLKWKIISIKLMAERKPKYMVKIFTIQTSHF